VAGNAASQQGQLGVQAGNAQAGLANQTQTQGLADVNALSTLGSQQQTIQQNKQLMPLDVLGKQAAVMSGAQLPMTTTSTMNGSPLSAIASLGALGIGMTTSGKDGQTPYDNLKKALGIGTGSSVIANSNSPTGYMNNAGQPVNQDGSASSAVNTGTSSDYTGGLPNYAPTNAIDYNMLGGDPNYVAPAP
jgi:hypothetical protein